jgi:hypothetical protein
MKAEGAGAPWELLSEPPSGGEPLPCSKWRAGEGYSTGSVVLHGGRRFLATSDIASGREAPDWVGEGWHAALYECLRRDVRWPPGESRVLLVLQLAQVRGHCVMLCGLHRNDG